MSSITFQLSIIKYSSSSFTSRSCSKGRKEGLLSNRASSWHRWIVSVLHVFSDWFYTIMQSLQSWFVKQAFPKLSHTAKVTGSLQFINSLQLDFFCVFKSKFTVLPVEQFVLLSNFTEVTWQKAGLWSWCVVIIKRKYEQEWVEEPPNVLEQKEDIVMRQYTNQPRVYQHAWLYWNPPAC